MIASLRLSPVRTCEPSSASNASALLRVQSPARFVVTAGSQRFIAVPEMNEPFAPNDTIADTLTFACILGNESIFDSNLESNRKLSILLVVRPWYRQHTAETDIIASYVVAPVSYREISGIEEAAPCPIPGPVLAESGAGEAIAGSGSPSG